MEFLCIALYFSQPGAESLKWSIMGGSTLVSMLLELRAFWRLPNGDSSLMIPKFVYYSPKNQLVRSCNSQVSFNTSNVRVLFNLFFMFANFYQLDLGNNLYYISKYTIKYQIKIKIVTWTSLDLIIYWKCMFNETLKIYIDPSNSVHSWASIVH